MQTEGTLLEGVNVSNGCGEAEAEFDLGVQFANAGGHRNHAQAVLHFLEAAAQNHLRAQVHLSAMYAHGHGVRRDQVQCLMWLTKAAHFGDPEAQYTLGMRLNRMSLDKEIPPGGELRIEAYKWLRLAAAPGYPDAQVGCDFVSMGMTRETVAQGNRRAAAFVVEHRSSI